MIVKSMEMSARSGDNTVEISLNRRRVDGKVSVSVAVRQPVGPAPKSESLFFELTEDDLEQLDSAIGVFTDLSPT